MKRFRSFVGDHLLAVFVVLACAFYWWLVPVAGNPLGSGPCIAALVLLALSKCWPGVRDLLRQIVRWRVSWKWYALALLLPITAAVIAAVITVRLGAPAPTASALSTCDVVLILAAGDVFGALVVGSGGSVLLAMLMHAANNAVSGEFISPMFSGQDAATLGWIRAGIWCLFALAALMIGGLRFWTQAPQQPATPVTGAPEIVLKAVRRTDEGKGGEGFVALITTIVGATIGVNLLLLALDMASGSRPGGRAVEGNRTVRSVMLQA